MKSLLYIQDILDGLNQFGLGRVFYKIPVCTGFQGGSLVFMDFVNGSNHLVILFLYKSTPSKA